MNWYLNLDIHRRIAIKYLCIDITGIDWPVFIKIFGFKESILLIGSKLKREGII